MSHRFYSEDPIAGDSALLRGEEAQHLVQVMRAKVGDEVVLFDGSGAEFRARITALGRREATLEVLTRVEIDRLPRCRITVGVALPKGERQKWLVEKLAELGAARLVPLIAEHGVAQPTEAACQRLWRTGIEAAKQCGRNRLLEIAPPVEATRWFAECPADALRFHAHPPEESREPTALRDLLPPGRSDEHPALYAAIGPEGGFSASEVAAAEQQGWRRVTLGERVLRVETAAIALVAGILSLRP